MVLLRWRVGVWLLRKAVGWMFWSFLGVNGVGGRGMSVKGKMGFGFRGILLSGWARVVLYDGAVVCMDSWGKMHPMDGGRSTEGNFDCR